MKIVVLDGHTLNPGDLSWDGLLALGDCSIHERSSPPEIAARLAEAEAVLTNKAPITAENLRRSPRLRYIGVTATGFNVVDAAAAGGLGITVTNVPAYGTDSVAQAAFALLLELAHRTGHHARTVREGRWSASPDFCYWDYPLIELAGLTLGIIGLGRIGKQVAKIARAFGLKVLAVRRNGHTITLGTPGQLGDPADPETAPIALVSLETLLRESDIVSLHCPLTPETENLINRERLSLMKKSAFLINTSRGALVVEEDLAQALQTGVIAGAGLDVLRQEPPASNHPLFSAPNCLITPHQAWATRSARSRLLSATIDNLRAFLQGAPKNVVSRR